MAPEVEFRIGTDIFFRQLNKLVGDTPRRERGQIVNKGNQYEYLDFGICLTAT
jgi:hypothetical protein